MDEIKKEDVQKIVDELATLKQDKENLVNELKELRSKKTGPTPEEIEAKAKDVVTKMLEEQTQKNSSDSRKNAEEKFKKLYPEFNPENDTAGLNYSTFQKKMERINLSNLSKEEEYLEAFEDAYVLMNKNKIMSESSYSPQFESQSFASKFKTSDGRDLSEKEVKLLKQNGWDKDKYLKMKEKRPAYVRTLLEYVN